MDHVTDEHLRSWYLERDLLGVSGERVIGEGSTLEQTVDTIWHDSELAAAAPLAACPVRCAHCQDKAANTAAKARN